MVAAFTTMRPFLSGRCADTETALSSVIDGTHGHDTPLAALRERLHSGGMAERNAVAIAGIGIFLIVGVIVAVGIAGTVLLFLYGIVVVVCKSAFGIELPHLF
jgi:hypothetical protein